MAEHDRDGPATSDRADGWVGVSEAARILRLSTRQTRRYAEQGRILSKMAGHRRLFNRADVRTLAAELGADARPAPPPSSELMPAGEVVEAFERQQQQLVSLSREVGRLQGILEAQRPMLEDVETQRGRVAELEAERAVLVVELERTHRELEAARAIVARRPWWLRLFRP